jgi:membrane protease YdiL (CAAX protease family)
MANNVRPNPLRFALGMPLSHSDRPLRLMAHLVMSQQAEPHSFVSEAMPMSDRSTYAERFNWLEYNNRDDFPYYRGWPTAITTSQWRIVLASVAVAFLVLGFGLDEFKGDAASFIPRILFVAIPLGTLAVVAGKHWTAMFRKIRVRDVAWMVGFAILNLVVTMAVGLITVRLFDLAANAASVMGKSPFGIFSFYAGTGIQLFGEELLTILPFLAIMQLCTKRFGLSRKAAVLWAWGGSAIFFGLIHLPTYQWNLFQCLIVINIARLVLSLAYIKTKNIWVSTGAHILNDWVLFTLPLAASMVVPT